MQPLNKKHLSERDICSKYITPALVTKAGWNLHTQIREEVSFTKGRVYVQGKIVNRGKSKRADYILYYKPNIPIAVIEAKDNNQSVGAGIQQALEYAEILDLPFAYSSNGDAFIEHDFTITAGIKEREISLDAFPSPQELWQRYCNYKGIDSGIEAIVTQDYYDDGSGKKPRYYQEIAINKTIEAIAKGENRILLEAQLKQSVADSEKLMETAVRQLLDVNTIAADDICVEPTTLETKTVKQSTKKTQSHGGEAVQLNLPLF